MNSVFFCVPIVPICYVVFVLPGLILLLAYALQHLYQMCFRQGMNTEEAGKISCGKLIIFSKISKDDIAVVLRGSVVWVPYTYSPLLAGVLDWTTTPIMHNDLPSCWAAVLHHARTQLGCILADQVHWGVSSRGGNEARQLNNGTALVFLNQNFFFLAFVFKIQSRIFQWKADTFNEKKFQPKTLFLI